jgi:hypothetical protein
MMLILRVVPALIVPFILYILLLAGGAGALSSGHAVLIQIPTITGAGVGINAGDLVTLVTVICLSLDLGAASSTASSAIVHLCVDAAFAVLCLIMFLMSPAFATASFLTLTVAALLEFMVGAGIMVVSARRDVAYASGN